MLFIQFNDTKMKKEHIKRLIVVALKDMCMYRKLSELGFQSEHHTLIPEVLLNMHKPEHSEQEFLEHLMLYEEVYQLSNIKETKALDVISNNIYNHLITNL